MSQIVRPVVLDRFRHVGSWALLGVVVLSACGGGDGAGSVTSYTVAGTLSGLAAGQAVALQLNAGTPLTLATNGGFVFPAALPAGSSYAVTIKTPPTGQACSVAQGRGVVTGNVTNVAVTCGAAPASGVPALVGDWVILQCTALNATSSARTLIRVAQTGETTFNWGNGLLQYASADCTGPGTVMPVVAVGSVQVNDVKTALGIAAHWGKATLVTGTSSYGVWAKRSATELCLVGDESPTLFASADAVLRAIEVAPQGMCYARLQ